MVAETYSSDDDSAAATIAGDLDGALAVEEEYLSLIEVVLADLNTARTNYREVQACYAKYTTTGTATITPTLARDSIELASTTITTALDPQIADFTTLRADSQQSIDELTSLIERTAAALTNEELVLISNDYRALRASGILHNATDLEYLKTGLLTSLGTIETMLQDSQIKLSVCREA